MITKYIPFLKINNPPSIYDLRRAKEKASKRTGNTVLQRWDVEKVERRQLLNAYGAFETVYVSIDELKQKATQKIHNLVGVTYPAVCQLSDRAKLENYAAAPQFAFGGFYNADKLFLIDDIFEWSHHRISWDKIRTAHAVIRRIRRGIITELTNKLDIT